jgi:SNF2 family DNA or RNA helicase
MIRRLRNKFHRFKPYSLKKKVISCSSRIECTSTLFPFQELCTEWLEMVRKQCKNAIVPLPMGLGKTLISLHHSLNQLNNYRRKKHQYDKRRKNGHVLFITLPGIVGHIHNQVNQHFKHVRINNNKFLTQIGHSDITILSYRDLRDLVDPLILQQTIFHTVIFDEFHELRSDSKQCKKTNDILGDFFIGLSGTPPNPIQHPSPLVNAESFHCGKPKKEFSEVYEKGQDESIIERVKLVLPESELKLYLQKIQDYKSNNCKKGNKSWNLLREMRKFLSSLKVKLVNQFLIENIAQFHSYKIVVFSEFASSLFALALMWSPDMYQHLHNNAVSVEEAIHRFQTNPKCCFLFATREVAGCGINLGFVDIMILLEPSYHLSQTQHLIGRIKRLGQCPLNLKNQRVLEVVIKDTCEENIIESKIIKDLKEIWQHNSPKGAK